MATHKLLEKTILVLAGLCICIALKAQYDVKLIVTEIATKQSDKVYVAGNFNNWNPGDETYALKPLGVKRRSIVLKGIKPGLYQFKFTRGSWEKAETTAKGEQIENRVLSIQSDTTVNYTIDGWSDDFPDKPKPNTASKNVYLLDSNFFMPQLNRHRAIYIYLPDDYYSKKNQRFPVLYMHDGQNLFNVQTAAFGEWGIDEAVDTLYKQLKKGCIIVGINNGGENRMHEYNPYNHDTFGIGEGEKYVEFLTETFKPYIDSAFRTKSASNYTYIAGSSMGGLISMYAVLTRPQVFGAAGIFSPAFWVAPEIYNEALKANLNTQPQFYFFAGGKESETMVTDMAKMVNIIKEKNCCYAQSIVLEQGLHNEKYWRAQFQDFYQWLMRQ